MRQCLRTHDFFPLWKESSTMDGSAWIFIVHTNQLLLNFLGFFPLSWAIKKIFWTVPRPDERTHICVRFLIWQCNKLFASRSLSLTWKRKGKFYGSSLFFFPNHWLGRRWKSLTHVLQLFISEWEWLCKRRPSYSCAKRERMNPSIFISSFRVINVPLLFLRGREAAKWLPEKEENVNFSLSLNRSEQMGRNESANAGHASMLGCMHIPTLSSSSR